MPLWHEFWSSVLRILPTFADALRKKIHTRASFEKTLPNYISAESLINVVFDKSIILATFFFCEALEAGTNRNDRGLFDWIYRVSNAAIRKDKVSSHARVSCHAFPDITRVALDRLIYVIYCVIECNFIKGSLISFAGTRVGKKEIIWISC